MHSLCQIFQCGQEVGASEVHISSNGHAALEGFIIGAIIEVAVVIAIIDSLLWSIAFM